MSTADDRHRIIGRRDPYRRAHDAAQAAADAHDAQHRRDLWWLVGVILAAGTMLGALVAYVAFQVARWMGYQ